MERNLNIIENCFVRQNKKCGRVLNGSKMAFIATPAADYVQLELEIIKSKLKQYEIEPYVAVEHRAFGKDVFCEKICGKIIESLFCIVLLNDKTESANGKKISVPNPNVYYEYGMMTSLNKLIIPLQRHNQNLAFNIQSLDTIKYTEKNFATEVESAIRNIFVEEDKAAEKQHSKILPKELSIYLGLKGIVWPQLTQGSDFETALLVGNELGFLVLADFANYNICYLRVINNDDDEKDSIICVKAIQKRLESLISNLLRHIDTEECAEYVDGKRVVNEAISNSPESKRQLQILRASLRMFGLPQIYLYREKYQDKDSVVDAVGKFEQRFLKPKLILLDKKEIISFIESESS